MQRQMRTLACPQFDFWLRLAGVGRQTDILVSRRKCAHINTIIKQHAMNASVVIDNVQRLIDAEAARSKIQTRTAWGALAPPRDTFFDDFQRLDVIYAFIDKLARQYPKLAAVSSIGKSF